RQTLDVRREHILARHGNAHAEDGLHDEAVRRRGARAIGRRDLEGEVVHAFRKGDHFAATYLLHDCFSPAWGWNSSNLTMSQACVGQRSAHSPQCKHTSSSLTITRPVCFRPSDTNSDCLGLAAGAVSLVRSAGSSSFFAI